LNRRKRTYGSKDIDVRKSVQQEKKSSARKKNRSGRKWAATARHCAAASGWADAGLGCCAAVLHWAKKRFRERKRNRTEIDRSVFFLYVVSNLRVHVLELAEAGRGWPWRAPGGQPAAGMVLVRRTAAREGGSDGGDASCVLPTSSAMRPWRELRVADGAGSWEG